MARNIVDILRKGNQELFHSAMISWLLDPEAEHGYGGSFLEGLAERLTDKGTTELKGALTDAGLVSVTPETTSRNNRYDILLGFGPRKFVFENKTKSVGELSQLERYEKDENVELAVALGLCEASFVEDLGFPLITYRDILSILNGLPSRHSDFGVLVRHYQDYLERELELLDLIIECYAQGHGELRGQILESIETGPYTANDRRFLSLFLLESFRRSCLKDGPRWGGSAWETNKNDRSGVWMASRNGLPDAYEFATSLRGCVRR